MTHSELLAADGNRYAQSSHKMGRSYSSKEAAVRRPVDLFVELARSGLEMGLAVGGGEREEPRAARDMTGLLWPMASLHDTDIIGTIENNDRNEDRLCLGGCPAPCSGQRSIHAHS